MMSADRCFKLNRIKENEVYVGNLPTNVTEERLMKKFQDSFSDLIFLGLHKDGLKTYCFIDCGSPENAIEFQRLMNKSNIDGRLMCVRRQSNSEKEHDRNTAHNVQSTSPSSSSRRVQMKTLTYNRSKETLPGEEVLSRRITSTHEVDIPNLKPAVPSSVQRQATGKKRETYKQNTYDQETIPPLKLASPLQNVEETIPPLKLASPLQNRCNEVSGNVHAVSRLSGICGKEDMPPLKSTVPCNSRSLSYSKSPSQTYSPLPYAPSYDYSYSPSRDHAALCSHACSSPDSCCSQHFHGTQQKSVCDLSHCRKCSNNGSQYSSKNYASPQMQYDEEDTYDDEEDTFIDIPDEAVVLSVANFPYRTTEEMIYTLCEDYNPIYVVMMCNYPDPENVTEAYVIVPNEKCALDAIMNLDKTQYRNRTLLVTDAEDIDILHELRCIQKG